MAKVKKKFKETKFGKIITSGPVKSLVSGALDVLPLPNVMNWIDKDKNGKVNWEDVKQFKSVDYLQIAGAVGFLAILIKFEIVNFEQVVELLKVFGIG